MLAGRPPFDAPSAAATRARVRAGGWAFPEGRALSPAARDLIHAMLGPDPAQRPALAEVAVHPFLAAHCTAGGGGGLDVGGADGGDDAGG